MVGGRPADDDPLNARTSQIGQKRGTTKRAGGVLDDHLLTVLRRRERLNGSTRCVWVKRVINEPDVIFISAHTKTKQNFLRWNARLGSTHLQILYQRWPNMKLLNYPHL
mgnify:FL=1